MRSSFSQVSRAGIPTKSQIMKKSAMDYLKAVKFDYNIQVGDEVEARFTNIAGWKRFKARVVKVNKNTVRVVSLEDDKPWPGEKAGSREYVIERVASDRWSWNNGIFEIKSPSKSARQKGDVYRILFAPDGKHWIDDKANDRQDVAVAVREARYFKHLMPMGKVKVVNVDTGCTIIDE